MSAENQGIGLIGPDPEPVTRMELTAGSGEVLWWVLDLILDFVW